MWIALWVVLVLVLGVLAVLALPVRLRLHAESAPARRLRLQLGLLGGLAPWIAMADSTRPRKARTGAAMTKVAGSKQKRRRFGRGRVARMLRAGPALIGGVLACVQVDRFRVDCTFGLNDPADTGQVFGVLAPFVYGARWGRGAAPSVRLTPVFDRACLEGEADVALAVRPIRLLGPMLRFAWASFGPGR